MKMASTSRSALFGGVYEATGLDSKDAFAVKVLHKSELAKSPPTLQFCEVPLSEIRRMLRGMAVLRSRVLRRMRDPQLHP